MRAEGLTAAGVIAGLDPGIRMSEALHAFLDEHAASMARPALRLVTEKLSVADRARHRG